MSITLSATRAPAARLAAFSAIMLPVTAAQVPIGVYLPALYAQHFGVPLGLLGAIFLAERVWGTAADPIIGWLSDRTRSRFGRRKSWIAAGSVVYAGATILLFFPVLKVTALYLACSLFVFYLSWSMMQIPYLAWSGELSGDYHERTRIATAQSISAALSLMLVLALPVLVDQIRSSDAGLKLGAMGGLIVFFVASYVGLPRWASGLYLLQFVFGIVAAPIWAASRAFTASTAPPSRRSFFRRQSIWRCCRSCPAGSGCFWRSPSPRAWRRDRAI